MALRPALRLMRIAPRGQDIRFDEKQIEEGRTSRRNFGTSLASGKCMDERCRSKHRRRDGIDLRLELLARLNETIDAIEAAYREYQFNTVAQRLLRLCLERLLRLVRRAAKTESSAATRRRRNLRWRLWTLCFRDNAIAASLHAHITEELWSLLDFGETSIQFALPPEKIRLDDVRDLTGKRQLVSAIYQTIQAGRNLRAESKLPSNRKIRFILRTDEKLISSQISDADTVIECRRSGTGSEI